MLDLDTQKMQKINNSKEFLQDMNKNLCPICYDIYDEESIVFMTNCNHYFHRQCIEDSINKTQNGDKCPICRNHLKNNKNE